MYFLIHIRPGGGSTFQEQCLFWMVLSYNRPTGHLTKWKGEGTYIEMYSMYVKSYENNYVLDWVT